MKTNEFLSGFIKNNWLLLVSVSIVALTTWYFTTNMLDDYYANEYREGLQQTMDEANQLRAERDMLKGEAEKKKVENELLKEGLEKQAEAVKEKGNNAVKAEVLEQKDNLNKLNTKRKQIEEEPADVQRAKLCAEAEASGFPLSKEFCEG